MAIETGDLAPEMERIASAYRRSVEQTGRGNVEAARPAPPTDCTEAEWREMTEAQQ